MLGSIFAEMFMGKNVALNLQITYSPAAHWGRLLPMGMDLLTEIYVIYQAPRSIGYSRSRCDTRPEGRKPGRKARQYMMMIRDSKHKLFFIPIQLDRKDRIKS